MKHHKSQDSVETPIASLIDVVFLLIIFFVVTASVERDLTDESITLAQAKYAPVVDKKSALAITINVRKDGEANIGLQPMNPKLLQNILTATRKSSGNAVPIVIRGDAETLYGNIDDVMQVIDKSGLHKVSLSAEATGTGE
jgi:biopolymer transport protein ExbD